MRVIGPFQPGRRARRALTAVVTGALVVPTVVLVNAAPAEAQTRAGAMASGFQYAKTHGYKIGIAVLDTKTGQTYGSGYYDRTTFASESVVKVFIATRLLISGQMKGSTKARAYKMITQSDDAIASSLYGRVGGDGLITWMKKYFHEPDLGSPPHRANWWGNTHIRALGLVRLYAKLKANRRVAPWLLNAMHHATRHGSDGTYQFFGIPSATTGAAIKQGWGTDYDDWSFSADFNTTGFVDHDRYAVAILARGPLGTYGSKIGAMLTAVAKRILPHGTFPDLTPTVTGLSLHSGRTSGATSVTVYGTSLTHVQNVYFGAARARLVQSGSPGHLVALAPKHAAGVVGVRVVTDHGSTASVQKDQYTYVAPPAISGLSTHAGRTGGSNVIAVYGSHFTKGTQVVFGSTPATEVKVLSRWRIHVTVPRHPAGSVRVSVTTAYGNSPSVTADQYTYVAPPTVTVVAPTSGSTAGGERITVTGTGYTSGSTVRFGTVAGTAVTVSADGSLTVTAPAQQAGVVDVRVVTPYGTSPVVTADRYTYVTQ